MNEHDVEVQSLRELHDWLGGLDDRVDDWLHDVVDESVLLGEERLVAHAPGGIGNLVGVDRPRPGPSGSIVTGEAYVDPDLDEGSDIGGLGSSPADYPYYADVGTGIFGDTGTPITAFPGHLMGPIEYGGRMIYVKSIKGQPAQRYSDAAARDVDVALGFRLGTLAGRIVAED